MATNPWTLLKSGAVKKGLRQLEHAYKTAHEMDLSSNMQLGVAYLWLREFEAAGNHFRLNNEKFPVRYANFYEMAGVANWCLEKRESAVEQWRIGLNCGYTDAAGGVKLPLLLFVASVLSPELISQDEAKKHLSDCFSNPRIGNWPGPLAKYVLGIATENDLRREHSRNEAGATLNVWQSHFYAGIIAKAGGDLSTYRMAISETGVMSDDDFDVGKPEIYKLWNAEFYIARNELES